MDDARLCEQAALVALLRTRPNDLSWTDIMVEVRSVGSALDVWHNRVQATLVPCPGHVDPLEQAAHDVTGWIKQGLIFLTVLDQRYPSRLLGVHQAPPVLFGRGKLITADRAVSVVGSRQASERGMDIARRVARALVSEGVTVAAGLALGIDTAAHRAALDSNGRTVAVVGTGINRSYPAVNKSLQEEIVRTGLVLSQFWPDAPPQRHNFLMRNATMSGYSLATVVIEAGEKSGSRAQARMAVEHGRPVILTDIVVENNEWAKLIVGRPGVYVASSIRELVDTLRTLVADSSLVEDAARRLVDGID